MVELIKGIIDLIKDPPPHLVKLLLFLSLLGNAALGLLFYKGLRPDRSSLQPTQVERQTQSAVSAKMITDSLLYTKALPSLKASQEAFRANPNVAGAYSDQLEKLYLFLKKSEEARKKYPEALPIEEQGVLIKILE